MQESAAPIETQLQVAEPRITHVPTAIELATDEADIRILRELYGPRAQTILNILLAFDAYFRWYYPLKESIPFMADKKVREARAFDNCITAIDLHEIVERLTARGLKGHQSFLFHGVIFKVTRDILSVGDVWATGSSPLELQNAETKRVAESSASRRLSMTGKYTTTTAISTLRNLLATQYLRRGDGLISMRDSRRTERVFGQDSLGRLALPKVQKTPVDMSEYDPKMDTCVKAFVRLLASVVSSPEPS